MKIAVVGAGIYGTTVAIKLAESGHEIDLFEKGNDILQAASGINQYRIHRGYHYPRSFETAITSKKSSEAFVEMYKEAIVGDAKHYYSIAKEKSKIDAKYFLDFCDQCGLEYEKVENLDFVNEDAVELTVLGKESLMDPIKIREIVWSKIKNLPINVKLNSEFGFSMIDSYEKVINCTYANTNFILEKYPEERKKYQFELCEKPILELPAKFKNISLVILDGPFTCIDPYANTDLHLMGNVVHAIHATNVGLFPEIPEPFLPLLNKGIVKNPPITNIAKFIEVASYFMPGIEEAKHVGSMYTVRTVLPNVDRTDERPTLVSVINKKVVSVFSGKIGNCVEAAEDVLDIIEA
jgi:hypothetical protein